MLCLYIVYHVYHPSPYLHAIVGFFKRAIACIRLPSSHAATLAYPRLASVASISASSHSLAPRRLISPSSSSTVPRVVLLLSSESFPSLITTPNVVTSIPSTLVTTLCSSLARLACFRRRPATTCAAVLRFGSRFSASLGKRHKLGKMARNGRGVINDMGRHRAWEGRDGVPCALARGQLTRQRDSAVSELGGFRTPRRAVEAEGAARPDEHRAGAQHQHESGARTRAHVEAARGTTPRH